ncbi:LysR family transcriptional regulator [Nocardioides sp. LHG3406-4]|uniref:LysR family transcriptional regulator n=1 Tax=Nocardioides sp. LHG3406-4 TaxID=2804575 RepID=UPI003CEE335B
MELRTLAYAEAVARLGGFTRAARELHVAQPAVSTQIAQLERELGVRLFVRTPRGVTTTEAGELLVARARRILTEAAAVHADIDALRGLVTGRLNIGATPLLGGVDLAGALAAFRRAHPHVVVRTHTDLVDPLLVALDSAQLDVVLGPVEDPGAARHQVDVLAEESVVLACPPGLSPPPRDLAEASSHEFVCLPATSGLRRILDRAAHEANVTLAVTTEVATTSQIREFVAAGLGVALLAASAARGPGPEIRVIELDPPVPHPPFAALRPTGRSSPAADAFVALLLASR